MQFLENRWFGYKQRYPAICLKDGQFIRSNAAYFPDEQQNTLAMMHFYYFIILLLCFQLYPYLSRK